MLTRRELIAAGGAAVLLAACGEEDEPRRKDRSEKQATDLKLLDAALNLEHTLVAAYTAGGSLLRGGAAGSARDVVAQEREHIASITHRITALGGRPNPPKTPEEYARAFPRLRTGPDALRFAVDLENAAVRFYLETLPKLSDRRLRTLTASIAAGEAQHAALLRGELGRTQVPDAFVTGRSQTG